MGFYELGVILAFVLSIVVATIWFRNTVDTEDESDVLNFAIAAFVVIIIASILSWASISALVIVKTTIVVLDYYKNKKES